MRLTRTHRIKSTQINGSAPSSRIRPASSSRSRARQVAAFIWSFLCQRLLQRGVLLHGTVGRAIITRDLWDKVRATLQGSPRIRAGSTRASTPALLKGLLFGPTGCAMSPTHTRRGDKLYRYYISQSVVKRGADDCPVSRVPAAEIENVVVDQLRGMLRAPEVIIATWRSARPEIGDLSEDGVRDVLAGLDPLWDELFPAEQARVIQLLVERVDVGLAGLKVRLRVQGLARMVQDLAGIAAAPQRAA